MKPLSNDNATECIELLGQPIKVSGLMGLAGVRAKLKGRMKKGDLILPLIIVNCTQNDIEWLKDLNNVNSLFAWFYRKLIRSSVRRSKGLFFVEGECELDGSKRVLEVTASTEGCLHFSFMNKRSLKTLFEKSEYSYIRSSILKTVRGKIHFYDSSRFIYSSGNKLITETGSSVTSIRIPGRWYHRLAFNIPLSRLLRSDQVNLMYDGHSRFAAILRDGCVFKFEIDSDKIVEIGRVNGFRGLMHNAHCFGPDGKIYFGEYTRRESRSGASIYCVDLHQECLTVAVKLPVGSCKHIHCVRYDKFTSTFWVCTGDENSDSRILRYSLDMELLEEVGGGTQVYRTCELNFSEHKVWWLMDSPLQPSMEIIYDRETKLVTNGDCMPGPVWYGVNIQGIGDFCSVADEPCLYPKRKSTSVLLRSDVSPFNWIEYLTVGKDVLPYIFKYASVEIGSNFGCTLYCNFQATSFMDGYGAVFKLYKKNEN